MHADVVDDRLASLSANLRPKCGCEIHWICGTSHHSKCLLSIDERASVKQSQMVYAQVTLTRKGQHWRSSAAAIAGALPSVVAVNEARTARRPTCLLYTSDAADE